MKPKIPVPLGDGTKVDVIRIEYGGQLVLTTKQLAEFYGCKTYNLTVNFNAHRNDFVELVDYYRLDGDKLRDLKSSLKRDLYQRNYTNITTDISSEFPIPTSAKQVYLWSKTGALKQSVYLQTNKAKLMYSGLALGYFSVDNFQTPPEENQRAQTSLFTTEETPKENIDKGNTKDFSTREKFEILKDFIDKCTDDNLRNQLIREAAKLITGKDF